MHANVVAYGTFTASIHGTKISFALVVRPLWSLMMKMERRHKSSV